MDLPDSDYVDIELSKPITVDGATVSRLRMREPTVGDQLSFSRFSGTDEEKEIHLMTHLCEIAPDDLKRLKLRDYKKLQAAFLNFIS